MNRIQKIVYTMACLLTATGAWAGDYNIRLNTPANGTMTSDVTTANHGVLVHLTVTPIDNYYLSALYYEKVVTDMGGAESPRRRSPGFSEKTDISIKTTVPAYISSHYGGTYDISMPPYDIEVTAIFSPCISIAGATLHWDTWDGTLSAPTSITYDGGKHTANVYLGSSDLTVDENYTITTNKRTNVGSITPTITGVGTYCGTINDQTIAITQRTLTITPISGQSKVYGEEDPTFTYTSIGLVAGDAISGALSRVTPENNNAGTYKITKGTLTAGDNYDITFVGTVDFTINPRNLTSIALTITLNHDFFNDNDGVQKAQINTIKYGDITLTEGVGNDYTYAYGTGVYGFTDYTTPDIYPINITFTGNYTGTKTVEYQIRKEITLNSSNDYRWRTFYEQTYNMGKDDNYFLAYTIRDVTTNAVVLDGPTVIKAGVPMVLYRTSVTDSGIYPPLIKTTDSNLTGTIWTNAYSQYNCKVDDNGVPIAWDLSANDNIMILVNDKFVRSKSGTLAAGKCYLDVSSSSPSSAPSLFIGVNTTGIEEIETQDTRKDYPFYDLSGRKISHPTKGLYIVNGKKIVIK